MCRGRQTCQGSLIDSRYLLRASSSDQRQCYANFDRLFSGIFTQNLHLVPFGFFNHFENCNFLDKNYENNRKMWIFDVITFIFRNHFNGILYENELQVQSKNKDCSYSVCKPSERSNLVAVNYFKQRKGEREERYTCYYNPLNNTQVR